MAIRTVGRDLVRIQGAGSTQLVEGWGAEFSLGFGRVLSEYCASFHLTFVLYNLYVPGLEGLGHGV